MALSEAKGLRVNSARNLFFAQGKLRGRSDLFVFRKIKQMLRCAQHDGWLFSATR